MEQIFSNTSLCICDELRPPSAAPYKSRLSSALSSTSRSFACDKLCRVSINGTYGTRMPVCEGISKGCILHHYQKSPLPPLSHSACELCSEQQLGNVSPPTDGCLERSCSLSRECVVSRTSRCICTKTLKHQPQLHLGNADTHASVPQKNGRFYVQFNVFIRLDI